MMMVRSEVLVFIENLEDYQGICGYTIKIVVLAMGVVVELEGISESEQFVREPIQSTINPLQESPIRG
ncbi:MAG: hypothetical protein MUO67_21730 [Anaerolineales bacterium]|nr:hypothetical protein [Anaerolineales bacterium]